MKKIRIRLSGAGGQGLLLAGRILATAVAIYGDRNVIHSQSYGPEARGGASKSDLVISDEEVIFPRPYMVDVLLSLNQKSLDKYYSSLRDGGVLIVDNGLIEIMPTENAYSIPFTHLAYSELGNKVFANVIALGALNEISRVIDYKHLKKAVTVSVPEKYTDKNIEALEMGVEKAKIARREYEFHEEIDWEL